MIRFLFAPLAALLLVGPLIAAPVPKALKKNRDNSKIVGVWEDSPGSRSCWIFNDDGTAGAGDPTNPAWKALYKIDPDQTPKHIDWSQDAGKSWYLGAYESDGETLKISFGTSGSGIRPTTVDKGNGFQWISTTRRGEVGK